ncbi:hypothetical protein [Coprothermobacter platensis]|uniref:hypothetical protein n=1 Tax=Coprothermobacter platensis TaxID=108819 RepID=UPI0003639640|nr:hypothetical protein [Coprothermobacter platensis]
MKKTIALVAVIALVAMALPAVTLAAQGGEPAWRFWNHTKTPTGALTATAVASPQLNATVNKAVANALGTSTQNIANLEKTYNVKLGQIVIAQAIVNATTNVTLNQAIQYISNHNIEQTLNNYGIDKDKFRDSVKSLSEKISSELKNLGVSIPWAGNLDKMLGLGKDIGKFMGAAPGMLTSTKGLGQFSATVNKVVAGVIGTTTQALSDFEKAYNVGLGEIVRAQAIVTSTTGVTLDSVLNYMTNHTLMQTLNNYGVTPDKFNASLQTLSNKIISQLKSQGINVPGWLSQGLHNGLGRHRGCGNW